MPRPVSMFDAVSSIPLIRYKKSLKIPKGGNETNIKYGIFSKTNFQRNEREKKEKK
jgi:hypothetical protein